MSRLAIVDELRACLEAEDGRTVAEIKAADTDCDTGKVVRVERYSDDTGWTIEWKSGDWGSVGIGLMDADNPNKLEPKVGGSITTYGRFGSELHGIDIDGAEAYWCTPFERVAHRVEWLANYDREKRERFEREQEKMDAAYDALPAPLKERIDRFRRDSKDFRVDGEAYEMFACTEAVKIAEALYPRIESGESADSVIKEFYDLPYEEQKKVVPLDDGHSGNTFGGVCLLARALLEGVPV